MTEPTDAELDAVLCKHWPAFSMQATLVRMWVRAAMRDAIAKWGTPPAEQSAPKAAPGERRNTKTHDLLSTMIGLFLGHKRAIGYKPGSVIDKVVNEAVEHLKDWPYPEAAPRQEAQDSVSPRHPVVMQWRDNAIEACAKIADAYGHEHAAQDMRAMLTAPQPAPAPLSDDTKRLTWMADGWTPGHEKLYTQHVLETGGVGDLDDLRTFIDKQIAAQGDTP